MPRSDLPFGSEFSPSQIDLPRALELADKHGGDFRKFEAAVRAAYFDKHNTSEYNKGKLANNCKLGMYAYGIIDREARLTEFGKELFEKRGDEKALYATLARHILADLHGMTLMQCILDMQASGETVDLLKLRQWLGDRGVHFPRGGKHASIMRLWLEKAGIFLSGWRVDEGKVKEVLGAGASDFDVLAQLSVPQRYYLRTLANMGGPGPFPSNEVEKLASATFGLRFDEKNLPKQVLYPLEKAGYVSLTRGTKQEGRGAKPFMVAPTEKLVADVLAPLLEQLEKQTDTDLRPLLRKPLPDIIAELTHEDKHVRGLALEALAFKLMRLLDMDYVATRLRGVSTGGAEVDLIFEAARLVFSRWQVQCKNTKSVSLDDVAKEVGLTHFLKSNVIVIVSTGDIGPEARKYANKVMADSNLCVIMIDGKDLAAIQSAPAFIVDAFNREARHAMKLKALAL